MADTSHISGFAGKLALLEVEDVATTPVQVQLGQAQGTSQPGFVQKARAPMASEEFERILSIEREHWRGNCVKEVMAIMEIGKEEAAEAVLQERLAAAAEAQALRSSLCEQAGRLAAARVAGTEASVAVLGEALREDSARTAEAIARLREEVAQVQSRSAKSQAPATGQAEVAELRAEARASRAEVVELRAEVARLRTPPGSHAGDAIVELRASVAQVQSSVVGQEEAVRRLAELSGEQSAELELAKASVELAHQRISELGAAGAAVAELREEVRCLQELRSERKQAPWDAAAEARGSLDLTPGSLDLTLPCAGASDACLSGQPCCGQQEAVADLRVAVEQLAARSLELEAREEAAARKAAADILELAGFVESFSAAQGEVERRVAELAEAGPMRGPGGDAEEAQIGSLRRLLQDQRRELAVLSSEVGNVRERCAAGSGRDVQWGAVCERVAKIESSLAATTHQRWPQESNECDLPGAAESPAGPSRVGSAGRLDELATTLPTSRSESPARSHLQEEQLPTLLGRTSTTSLASGLSPQVDRRQATKSVAALPDRRRAASPDGCASPRASAQEGVRPATEHGAQKAEPAWVSDRLKDSLEGVVNAVQRVLQEGQQQQQRQLEPAPAPSRQAAAPAPQLVRPGIPVQAPASWRLQQVVAARAGSPMVRVATAVAPAHRALGGSVVVPPKTPLLVRR